MVKQWIQSRRMFWQLQPINFYQHVHANNDVLANDNLIVMLTTTILTQAHPQDIVLSLLIRNVRTSKLIYAEALETILYIVSSQLLPCHLSLNTLIYRIVGNFKVENSLNDYFHEINFEDLQDYYCSYYNKISKNSIFSRQHACSSKIHSVLFSIIFYYTVHMDYRKDIATIICVSK